MPAVRDHRNAIANMAPRDSGFNARQPAFDMPAIVFDAPKTAPIAKRQNIIYTQQGIIPTYYNLSGPEPGTVVGIVLGSVAGFLLLCWLVQSLINTNNKTGTTTAMAGEEEIVVRRRRNSHGTRSSRRRSAEVREISRSPRRNSGRSQIIVEERRQAAPRARSIIVESRSRSRVPGDDVVEVIEEHEDYRERRGTRGGRGYR